MSKPIEWSPRAKQDYLNLLVYLSEQWGEKTINTFHDRLQSILELISERPEMFPSSGRKKQVRRCVLSRQISLYYRIGMDKIEVVALYGNRQNPAKRKL